VNPALLLSIRVASYLFLAGIIMVLASLFPAVQRRAPRIFLYGFLVAAGSLFVVLFAALLFR
jgi:hypothetical protein